MENGDTPLVIVTTNPHAKKQPRILAYGTGVTVQPPPVITDKEVAAILATGFVPDDDDWEKDPDYIGFNSDFEKAVRIRNHIKSRTDAMHGNNSISAVERLATWDALKAANAALDGVSKMRHEALIRAKTRNHALVTAYRAPLIEDRTRELLAEADRET